MWGDVKTVFITIKSFIYRDDQLLLPARPTLKAIGGDSWLISPKSFSDPQNCPKMAAWNVGKLLFWKGLSRDSMTTLEQNLLGTFNTALAWLSRQNFCLLILLPLRITLILTCKEGGKAH